MEKLRRINEELMTQNSTLKKEIVFEPIESANAQKQSQRQRRHEDNEQIKNKLKAEQEKRRRENEERLQRELEIEKELEKSERWDNIWKVIGIIVVSIIAIIVLWHTGLIIPLALIGLAASGFLKK